MLTEKSDAQVGPRRQHRKNIPKYNRIHFVDFGKIAPREFSTHCVENEVGSLHPCFRWWLYLE